MCAPKNTKVPVFRLLPSTDDSEDILSIHK